MSSIATGPPLLSTHLVCTFTVQVQVFLVLLQTRGGVEDTRLEAQAKGTKKIRGQGQGQPFR